MLKEKLTAFYAALCVADPATVPDVQEVLAIVRPLEKGWKNANQAFYDLVNEDERWDEDSDVYRALVAVKDAVTAGTTESWAKGHLRDLLLNLRYDGDLSGHTLTHVEAAKECRALAYELYENVSKSLIGPLWTEYNLDLKERDDYFGYALEPECALNEAPSKKCREQRDTFGTDYTEVYDFVSRIQVYVRAHGPESKNRVDAEWEYRQDESDRSEAEGFLAWYEKTKLQRILDDKEKRDKFAAWFSRCAKAYLHYAPEVVKLEDSQVTTLTELVDDLANNKLFGWVERLSACGWLWF